MDAPNTGPQAYTMSSFKDLFRIDAPFQLLPRDWVLDIPLPDFPMEFAPPEILRARYLDRRQLYLIDYIDERFGRDRCFYAFLEQNRGMKPRPEQLLVTNLYAYYEIDHWPEALKYMRWTTFVMQNMEYEALAQAQGSEQGLTRPDFPEDLFYIFAQVQKLELERFQKDSAPKVKPAQGLETNDGAQHQQFQPRLPPPPSFVIPNLPKSPKNDAAGAESDAWPAREQTHYHGEEDMSNLPENFNEVVGGAGGYENEETSNPRDGDNMPPDGNDSQTHGPGPALVSSPQQMPIPPSQVDGRLTAEGLFWACGNMDMYEKIRDSHAAWVSRQVKAQCRIMLRMVFSLPQTQQQSWQQCYLMARAHLHHFVEAALQFWVEGAPGVDFFVEQQYESWTHRMYFYILAMIRSVNPLPSGLTVVEYQDLNRKHHLAAMYRQQEILINWTREFTARLNDRRSVRYRFEPNAVLDLWTGTVETYAEFQARTT